MNLYRLVKKVFAVAELHLQSWNLGILVDGILSQCRHVLKTKLGRNRAIYVQLSPAASISVCAFENARQQHRA